MKQRRQTLNRSLTFETTGMECTWENWNVRSSRCKSGWLAMMVNLSIVVEKWYFTSKFGFTVVRSGHHDCFEDQKKLKFPIQNPIQRTEDKAMYRIELHNNSAWQKTCELRWRSWKTAQFSNTSTLLNVRMLKFCEQQGHESQRSKHPFLSIHFLVDEFDFSQKAVTQLPSWFELWHWITYSSKFCLVSLCLVFGCFHFLAPSRHDWFSTNSTQWRLEPETHRLIRTGVGWENQADQGRVECCPDPQRT